MRYAIRPTRSLQSIGFERFVGRISVHAASGMNKVYVVYNKKMALLQRHFQLKAQKRL